MYTFNPLSEEELNAFDLMEEGTYDFEVLKATRKVSKSGNPMAELLICLWDKNGKTTNVFDYLVFSNVNLNIRKVKHFCDSVGLSANYKKGVIPEELSGLSGKVHLGIQDEQPKPTGGTYPKKNVVIDYIGDGKETEKNGLKNDTFNNNLDDTIPF